LTDIKRFYTKGYSKKYQENYDKIFKDKKVDIKEKFNTYTMSCSSCEEKQKRIEELEALLKKRFVVFKKVARALRERNVECRELRQALNKGKQE
jgi:hypothetical protein